MTMDKKKLIKIIADTLKESDNEFWRDLNISDDIIISESLLHENDYYFRIANAVYKEAINEQ